MCSARYATLSASFMNALNLTHRFHRRPWTLSAITDESDFRSCKSHRGQPSGALVEYLNTPRIRLARHLKRTLVTYSAQAVHSRTDRRQSLDMPPMPHSPAFAMIQRWTSHITHTATICCKETSPYPTIPPRYRTIFCKPVLKVQFVSEGRITMRQACKVLLGLR